QASAAAPEAEGMPGVEPLNSEEGTLVFCPTCGMHMQKSGAFCEKCGMKLQSNSNDQYNNLPKNGNVPLWNTESEDYGYANMTEGEIDQINKFMSGGGISAPDDYGDGSSVQPVVDFGGADSFGGSVADTSEIEAITAQFSNMYPATNSEMPEIGAAVKQSSSGERMMDNFAMESTGIDEEYVASGSLPVVEGASMEYDPDEPEPEDPNAFLMTEEAIEDITPTYEEPVAEEVSTYEEPVAEAIPAYEEPVAEAIPTYEEPVAEAIPTYEEPVAEAIPAYEEPVAEEVPAYEEPVAEEVPAYEEPVAEEVPAYEEPVAEEVPAYEEPVASEPEYSIPVYSDDDTAAEESYSYSDNDQSASALADIPYYEEPEAEQKEEQKEEPAVTPFMAASAAAAVAAEAATSPVSAYSMSEAEAMPAIGRAASAPAVEDMAPVSAVQETAPVSDYGFAAASAPAPVREEPVSEKAPEQPEVDLGRLIYCRNCGQDMYEKELVCQNCGAPKRPEYQRPSQRKVQSKSHEPIKIFGFLPLPALIGAVAVIALAAFILVPSLLNGKDEITNSGSKTTSSTTTSVASDEMNAGGTEDTTDSNDPVEIETTEPAQSTDGTTSEPQPEVTEPVESDTSKPEETPDSTTASTPATTTSKPATTTSKPATTTSKPATTTTTKPATTTSKPSSSYSPSSTIVSQNKQRDKLISAYETITGEVGKLDAFARNAAYAIMFDSRDTNTAGKSFYASELGKAMLSKIKSGKATVASAVSGAKPTISELSAAYNALCILEDKYLEYYDYVVNASSFGSFESKCDKYLSNISSYASSKFKLSVLNTSAQTTTDKNEYYADVLSQAVEAAENASAAYTTLRKKISNLSESTFSSKFAGTMKDNISTYLKAAQYTQAVEAYCDILASAPSAYSSAYKNLKSACASLKDTADVFYLARFDNTLANFKSTTSSYLNAVASYVKKIKNAL
ncbi:MAG: hypothetical protein IJD85_01505, partial [Oscillospiraceae bacterium]|nr:hypothetical protein [Oscillospiraceae bacterium]